MDYTAGAGAGGSGIFTSRVKWNGSATRVHTDWPHFAPLRTPCGTENHSAVTPYTAKIPNQCRAIATLSAMRVNIPQSILELGLHRYTG